MSADKISLLRQVLSESYVVYTKLQNFHWHVTGPQFHSLHTMFEAQYTELAAAIDEIAERILTLGKRAPGSMAEFLKISSIKESSNELAAQEMLATLVADQTSLAETLEKTILLAQEDHDDVTTDLCIRRLDVHRKNTWMLRSSM